ncbi:MAG: hypothetical protein JW982_05055 [Spirochaetes bacterium]|nr:hypothetical protein [Spirochaetota bacterium]
MLLRRKNIFITAVFLITILSVMSCADSLKCTIANKTSSPVYITSEELQLAINVHPGEIKTISLNSITSGFNITFSSGSFSKVFYFRDVDHWFSVTHEVEIIINAEEIHFNGSRHERFEQQ